MEYVQHDPALFPCLIDNSNAPPALQSGWSARVCKLAACFITFSRVTLEGTVVGKQVGLA